jgi:selenide,water dikinase
VYRIDAERALVLTLDFFTPIVDDPYDYGRVAAANSLSDVYAMGGRPLVALNIAAFPEAGLPTEAIADILRGGAAVAKEAGIVIAGGHTVSDKEVKYGLSVVGIVHPDHIMQNAGAKPGDRLILTKPLGTGALSTALKMEGLDDDCYAALVGAMTTLNRAAAEEMEDYGVHACTDVTGYGLLGHGLEMAQASGVTLEIEAAAVPTLPGTMEMIRRGFLPGGTFANRRFIEGEVEWKRTLDEPLEHLLVDPQTSGGLLLSVPPEHADAYLASLRKSYPQASFAGRVTARDRVSLRVV